MKHVDWPSWPTATVPLANSGLLVAERYELRTQIGIGAMGAVWLAHDQVLGRSVALKQVVLEPGLDPQQASEARQRILREGRIAARLQHTHAVTIFDVVMHDGEPWLVMEYVPSRSLANVLTEEGLLTDRVAARIGMQLADALEAAHQAGIVHRDVKPGNVLVGHDGTAKLVDFGIARANGDVTVTQTGVLTGTPDYFAPEVARGGKPSPEADIFALGATLYICLEGEPPFGTNKNALTQLQVVADGKVRPPRQSGELTGVLMQLLAPEAERRPSARRASAMLRKVAEGIPPSTPAPRSPEHSSSARPDKAARARTQANGAAKAPSDRRARAQAKAPTNPRIKAPVKAPTNPRAKDPAAEVEPRTTRIPPPRSAPESWMPEGRALPPTPRELAAASAAIPTGRAAHRMRSLDERRRLILIVLGGLAGVAVLIVALLSAIGGRQDATPVTPPPAAATAAHATDAQLADTVRDYYNALPKEPATAWRKLTQNAQIHLGGQSAFTGMWADIRDLHLVSTSTSADDQSVQAQLRLQTSDGQEHTSSQRLLVVSAPGGKWLIDSIGN